MPFKSIHAVADGKIFILFYGWVVFHCIYTPHLYVHLLSKNFYILHHHSLQLYTLCAHQSTQVYHLYDVIFFNEIREKEKLQRKMHWYYLKYLPIPLLYWCSLSLHVDLNHCLIIWITFISAWRTPFNISYRASLLAINCLNFCLSENLLSSLSLWRIMLPTVEFWVDSFSWSPLNMLCCRQNQGSMCAADSHQGQRCIPRQELDLKQMRMKPRLGGKRSLPRASSSSTFGVNCECCQSWKHENRL